MVRRKGRSNNCYSSSFSYHTRTFDLWVESTWHNFRYLYIISGVVTTGWSQSGTFSRSRSLHLSFPQALSPVLYSFTLDRVALGGVRLTPFMCTFLM